MLWARRWQKHWGVPLLCHRRLDRTADEHAQSSLPCGSGQRRARCTGTTGNRDICSPDKSCCGTGRISPAFGTKPPYAAADRAPLPAGAFPSPHRWTAGFPAGFKTGKEYLHCGRSPIRLSNTTANIATAVRTIRRDFQKNPRLAATVGPSRSPCPSMYPIMQITPCLAENGPNRGLFILYLKLQAHFTDLQQRSVFRTIYRLCFL